MTYHFNTRITRWLSTFQQRMRKNTLYSARQKYNTVVLDLRTLNILISALPTIDQLISKTFHLEGNQRVLKTKRYCIQKIPFIGEKSRWRMLLHAASRIRCIQKVAHFSFHTCFGGNAGKIRNTGSRNTNEKNKAKQGSTGKYFFRRKEFFIIKFFPYRTVCFGRLATLPSFAAGQKLVSQTSRGCWLVKCLRCCCRPSRLLVELAAKYNPPLGLCILNAEPIPTGFKRENFILHLRLYSRFRPRTNRGRVRRRFGFF